MARYKLLIFDIDDTLIDYKAASRNALHRCFTEAGLPVFDDLYPLFSTIDTQLWSLSQSGAMTPEEVIVRRFEDLNGHVELPLPAAGMSERFTAHLVTDAPLIPGALAILEKMQDRATIIAGTNGISWIQRARIEQAGIEKFFSHVVVSEEAGVTKPNIGFYEYLHEQLGYPDKSGMLMIGDSIHSDIAGGAGFNIDTCWYNPKGQVSDSGIVPTHQISSLDQLFSVLI